jgi:hypothetical protein
MLHQIRRHLRVLAAAVLVSVSALGAWSSLAHKLDCHDAECLPVAVAHDASAHAFRSAAPPEGEREIHCVLCHWTRTFGPGVQSVAATPTVANRSFARSSADASVARLIAAVQPPLRAPPVASTFDVVA